MDVGKREGDVESTETHTVKHFVLGLTDTKDLKRKVENITKIL